MIDTGGLVVTNFKFVAPSEFSLTLNGIPLDSTVEELSDSDEFSDGNMVSYLPEALFAGKYRLSATSKEFESIEEDVIIRDGDVKTLNSVIVKQSVRDDLIQKTVSHITTILNAVTERKSFNTLNLPLSTNQDEISNLKYEYEDLIEDFTDEGIKSVKLTNVIGDYFIDDIEQEGFYECGCEISFIFEMEQIYSGWWTGEIIEKSFSDTCDAIIYWRLTGDSWVISDCEIYI